MEDLILTIRINGKRYRHEAFVVLIVEEVVISRNLAMLLVIAVLG